MKSSLEFHLATWVFKPIIQFARDQHIKESEIWDHLGITRENFFQTTGHVDFNYLNKLILFILSKTENPLFGFELGYQKNILSGHVMDPFLKSCNTVFDIIRKIEEYNEVLSNFIYIKAEEKGDDFFAHFVAIEGWLDRYPVSSRIIRDFIITFFHKFILQYSNQKAIPEHTYINNPVLHDPEQASVISRYYTCPLHFTMKNDYMVYKQHCDVPMISSNPLVKQLLEEELLKLSKKSSTLSFKLQVQLMEIGDSILLITIDQIARANNMSVRRLQQLLKKENTSFRSIMEEMKLLYIKKVLLKSGISIKETADLLGYANTSSLYAFLKKKTGFTPKDISEDFK